MISTSWKPAQWNRQQSTSSEYLRLGRTSSTTLMTDGILKSIYTEVWVSSITSLYRVVLSAGILEDLRRVFGRAV